MQLVYFRGFGECRASRWVADPRALTDLMARIDCRGGQTQIGRVLRPCARARPARAPVQALVYVGDAMEEPSTISARLAGELGLLGVKAFMFHEGHDAAAARALQGDRAADRRRLCAVRRRRRRIAGGAAAGRRRLCERRASSGLTRLAAGERARRAGSSPL